MQTLCMHILVFLKVPLSTTLIHQILQVIKNGIALLVILGTSCIKFTANVRL